MNMFTRSVAFKREKEAIAGYIVNQILQAGQTIILDSGTTNIEIAQKIVEASLKLTVLTNSFSVATILTKSPEIDLYMASGNYDHQSDAFHDELSRALFDTMRADLCFISVNGISTDAGFTISGAEEAPIKQAMIKASRHCYVPADHSKLGKTGLRVICGLQDVTALICDTYGGQEEVKTLIEAGLNVILVDTNK